MPRSLKWLPEALTDLVRLREFIRVHNPDAAMRSAKRIREAAQRLLNLPFVGRPVTDIDTPEFRDLFISYGQGGYWMRYVVTDNEIIIIKPWHGREDR
ncbi:MAG: type II toxin-antitoxin system RelE/ParE family toxin [Pseudomonadota bacterium]